MIAWLDAHNWGEILLYGYFAVGFVLAVTVLVMAWWDGPREDYEHYFVAASVIPFWLPFLLVIPLRKYLERKDSQDPE